MKTIDRVKIIAGASLMFTVIGVLLSPAAFAVANFPDFVNNLILYIQGIAAVIAVLFIVVGAVKLKTAQGNPVAQTNAKATIGLAVGGFLIAVFAQQIIDIISKAAGV